MAAARRSGNRRDGAEFARPRSTRSVPTSRAAGGSWRSATPHREHRCGAVEPPASLTPDKQRRLCLSAEHGGCPTFRAARASRAAMLAPGIDPAVGRGGRCCPPAHRPRIRRRSSSTRASRLRRHAGRSTGRVPGRARCAHGRRVRRGRDRSLLRSPGSGRRPTDGDRIRDRLSDAAANPARDAVAVPRSIDRSFRRATRFRGASPAASGAVSGATGTPAVSTPSFSTTYRRQDGRHAVGIAGAFRDDGRRDQGAQRPDRATTCRSARSSRSRDGRGASSALAAAAERRHEAARLDLADPGPAARAGGPALVMDGEEVPDLLLERRRHASPQDLDRRRQRRLRSPRRARRPPPAPAPTASGTAAAARRGGSRRCRRCRRRR